MNESQNINRRILVIDDTASIHTDFRKVLQGGKEDDTLDAFANELFGTATAKPERINFQLDSAMQGQDGLSKIQASVAAGNPYSLAFVDMRMPPGWDGVQTIEQLWKADPRLQVVICTAYTDYSWHEIVKRLGASDRMVVLKKPFEMVEVQQLALALTQKWNMTEMASRQIDWLERTVEQGNQDTCKLTLALADQRDLLMAMESGVILSTTDARGRITSVNDKFCAISGYTREELIGQDHRIIGSGYHSQDFWAEMYAIVGSGGVWRHDVRDRAKDGRLFWCDTTIKGILGPDGELLRMVAVRADITDKKNVEAQLQQAQKLESIGQLAAGIAHEINTPAQYVGDNLRFLQDQFGNLLKVIDAYAARLDGNAPAKPWHERKAEIEATLQEMDFAFLRDELPVAIAQSLEGIDRVATIIKAMKDFSHPGSATKEPADLNRSIRSTIEVCRNRWKYVADLETDLAADLPAVPCLVAEFNQVILNLIVNAADAIAEKIGDSGAKGVIRVSSRIIGDRVEVRIADNGNGIPEAIKARMFEQFFTTKPVGKGTGQGLAISRNVIVKKHGGGLTFESTQGIGTTFIIELPLTENEPQKLEAA